MDEQPLHSILAIDGVNANGADKVSRRIEPMLICRNCIVPLKVSMQGGRFRLGFPNNIMRGNTAGLSLNP